MNLLVRVMVAAVLTLVPALVTVANAANNPCRFVYVTYNVSPEEKDRLFRASGADQKIYDARAETFTEIIFVKSAGCKGDRIFERLSSRYKFGANDSAFPIEPLQPRSSGQAQGGGNTSGDTSGSTQSQTGSQPGNNCPGTSTAKQPKGGTATAQTPRNCQNR